MSFKTYIAIVMMAPINYKCNFDINLLRFSTPTVFLTNFASHIKHNHNALPPPYKRVPFDMTQRPHQENVKDGAT